LSWFQNYFDDHIYTARDTEDWKSGFTTEILTDYFVDGYEILYNLDGSEIKNGPQLVSFIEKRLEYGDKILVVVDNVHSERTSTIFYAMDVIISRFTYIQNIMFLPHKTLLPPSTYWCRK
jgi:hypothetical protein